MAGLTGVRRSPCAACPYRRDVPSGVWTEEEYEKLRRYDGDLFEQSPAVFGCHADAGESLCAGWVGHREHPADLLALRLGAARRLIDWSVLDYRTTVPLFGSGAEAAEHGLREVDAPGPAARAAIEKIVRTRQLIGEPVIFKERNDHE